MPDAPSDSPPQVDVSKHFEDVSIEPLLRTTPLLAGLDRPAQDALIWRFRPVHFEPGDELIRSGDTGRDLLVLLDGFAEVYARAGERRYLVAILEPGSIIGEIGFFDRERERTADVVAATRGTAAILPHRVYEELLEDAHPAAESLERAVLQAVSLRMQYTNETLAELLDTHKSGGLLNHLAKLFSATEEE